MNELIQPSDMKEFLDKKTPKRGEVIDLRTGLTIIAACGEDSRLLDFIEKTVGELVQNDQFFVMYKTQPGMIRVGMVGQMVFNPNIRMVLMWSDHRDPVNNGAKTWLDFYDQWHWNRAVEHGEIALGNVQRSLADFLKELPINLAYLFRLRTGFWASYMRPKIDPNSPPIMGLRPSLYNTPSVGLYETGVGKVVRTGGILSLISISNDPAFTQHLDSIKQDLEKCVTI